MKYRVVYKPVKEQLPRIFKGYGADYADTILESVLHGHIKKQVSTREAEKVVAEK